MSDPSLDAPLPYTKSQVNRAGERIRKAAVASEPATADDLKLLNEYRAWHQPALERCQRELIEVFHSETAFDQSVLPITGRPLKTVEAITAKLVRSKTRLSRMQDIAGTRIVVPMLEIQDQITTIVQSLFEIIGEGVTVKDTRAGGDDFGYRAVHVVATLNGRYTEVQIRTTNQDVWAQLVERTDKTLAADLKHGQGPADWLEWLLELSVVLRQRDLGNLVPVPPTPYDLVESPEGSPE